MKNLLYFIGYSLINTGTVFRGHPTIPTIIFILFHISKPTIVNLLFRNLSSLFYWYQIYLVMDNNFIILNNNCKIRTSNLI